MIRDRHTLAETGTGAPIFWVLELDWVGGAIYLSTVDLEIDAADGSTIVVSGGMDEPTFDEAIEFLQDMSAAPASVAIQTIMPVDTAKMSALGHDLGSAIATLYRWVDGTTWEQRKTVMRGLVSDPEYETIDDPVRFSIEAQVWQDESQIPSSRSAVLATNWDDAMILSLAPEDRGLLYPVVIGRPGVVSTDLASAGWCSATVGVWVDKQTSTHGGAVPAGGVADLTLVVAGHHVTATEIYANTDTYTTGTRFLVRNGFDRKNHPVAFLSWWGTKAATDDPYVWDGAGTYTMVVGPPTCLGQAAVDASFQPTSGVASTVYLGWLDSTDGGGGMAAGDGSTMERAGDVLEWLLSQTSIPVDRGRCAAAKELLQGFKLGFTIKAATSPWEFAKDNILPLLPVSIVSGPNGLYPIVWRYDATSDQADIQIDADADEAIERASGIRTDRSRIVNDFTLRYGYTMRTGTYRGTARLGGLSVDVGRVSFPCSTSQGRYRKANGDPLIVEETLETACVYDDSTAYAILAWKAAAFALAQRRITYSLPLDRYSNIERGMVASLTDSDMYLQAHTCLVESVTTDDSPYLTVTFLLIEDIVRDPRRGAVV